MKQQVPYLGLLVLSILNFHKHLYTNQNFRLKTLQPINSCVSSTLMVRKLLPFWSFVQGDDPFFGFDKPIFGHQGHF